MYVLWKAHHSLALRTRVDTAALCLGAILKRAIASKKHQMQKYATKCTAERTHVQYESENEKAEQPFV